MTASTYGYKRVTHVMRSAQWKNLSTKTSFGVGYKHSYNNIRDIKIAYEEFRQS